MRHRLVRTIKRDDGLHLVVLTLEGYRQACNDRAVRREDIKMVIEAHIQCAACRERL